ncbi:hypothetical protein [Faunimonas pinastri]|uniref:hypothetical protein n=1 Tax=Faunimonas pinastri TaxID=1855383 RepID=UPI001EECD384|nr:hypothetical protein [Faunimonas pinastri]
MLHGWAFDPGEPSRRQRVILVSRTGQRLETLADRYRADLAAAGIGDGHHGFAVPLELVGSAAGIRALVEDGGFELPGSPFADDDGVPPLEFDRGSMRARIDGAHGSRALTGWVLDRQDRSYRPLLALRQGERVLSQGRPTRARRDMPEGFDGLHGFTLPLRPGVRGRCTLVDAERGTLLATFRIGRHAVRS